MRFKHHFKFEGTRYSLVKRDNSRDGSWFLRTKIDGQTIMRSLDTNIAATAEQRAIVDYIKPARQGNWTAVDDRRRRDIHPKLSKVFACYRQMTIGKMDSKTVETNINGMELVVRRAQGNDGMSDEQVGELSSGLLKGKLVADFEDWMGRDALANGRDLESNKRTVCAYLRHARSLFKKAALPRYKLNGVALPDVKEFMTWPVERAVKLERQQVDDGLLRATLEGVKQLLIDDKAVYIAFMLGLCSLRRGEMSKMRWEWVKVLNGQVCIMLPGRCPHTGEKITKNGKDRRVPIDPRVVNVLEQYKSERIVGLNFEDEQFVLPSPREGQGGPDCGLRGAQIFKRVSAFMRTMGWRTNKTLHELRALALFLVAKNHGLGKAQAVGGHADQRTTQQHYVGMMSVDDVRVNLPMELGGLPQLPE